MRTQMRARLSRKERIAVFLILLGAGLLLSTLVLGWYSTQLSYGSNELGETFRMTNVQLSGSQSGAPYSSSVSYPTAYLPHTGSLYLDVFGVVIAGAALGLLTSGLILSGVARNHRSLVSVLAVLTVVLAVAGPTLLLAAQPSVVCSDSSSIPPPLGAPPAGNGTEPECGWAIVSPVGEGSAYSTFFDSTPGPQSSFVGSGNANGFNHTWGPSIGWYIAWLASAILLLGTLLYFSGIHRFGVAVRIPKTSSITTDTERDTK
jgi:hypothetical protein